ncbi:MAG TPA: c-type cytochrome [Terriglobia bacterium]|nr:c-type cytochrome [Terriglobia bacterium]
MKRLAAVCSVLVLVVSALSAKGNPKAAHAKLVERGKYLVENLGMCADCHSPRDEKGQFIPSRYLEGTVLDFQPMHPVPGWFAAAPPIAGLPGWTRAEAVRFFMTGVDKYGKHAGPPMPGYRMSRRDAEAVAAYLKSLAAERK